MRIGRLDKLLAPFKCVGDKGIYLYAVVAELPLRIRIYDLTKGRGVDALDWTFLSLEKDAYGAYKTLRRWERPWNKLRLYFMLRSIEKAAKHKAMAIEAERVLIIKGIRRLQDVEGKPKMD